MSTNEFTNSTNNYEIIECVKCGNTNILGALSCAQCSWPFSMQAWKTTTHKIKRVTIDTNCINQKQADPFLNQLEEWYSKELIDLQRSKVMIKELRGTERIDKAKIIDPHPPVWILGTSRLGIDTILAGPDMSEPIEGIMFPTTKSLKSNQEYDVEHLRWHVLTGGDVFVTRDSKDYIVRGKKESLANFGIWVFQPKELVNFLEEIYGW